MTTDLTRAAYDAFAPGYDDFNSANDYEMWFGALLPKLEALGLRHGAVLDVGCGTGQGIAPMLRRGWEVTGCDLSPGMIEQARAKADGVRFEVHDMRELPVLGSFELVWALNDPVNYLLTEDDLVAAFGAMGANLAADGLLAFDCNTRHGMEALFGVSEEDERWNWEGLGGDHTNTNIYVARLSGAGVEAHEHRERYWSVPEIQGALEAAGLKPIAAMGQREVPTGVLIEDDHDEQRDHKVIHVARR